MQASKFSTQIFQVNVACNGGQKLEENYVSSILTETFSPEWNITLSWLQYNDDPMQANYQR